MKTISTIPKAIRNGFPLKDANYLVRRSDASYDTFNQKQILESFIEEHSSYLSPMSEANTIEETISGTVFPYYRLLEHLPTTSVLCLPNLDRLFKSVCLEDIEALHNILVLKNIRVLLANKREYQGMLAIIKLLDGKRKALALDKYVEFVSERMNESLDEINGSRKSASKSKTKERKGIRDYCLEYLRLIKSAFKKYTYTDYRLWIIGCFTGHLINEYLRDIWQADHSTRLPKFNMKELLILRAVETNHPDRDRRWIYNYSKHYNKEGSYSIDLKPDKISRLRGSRPYQMLQEYEGGKFEAGIEEIYSQLEPPEEKLSWTGLPNRKKKKLAACFPKIKGLRSWQLKTIRILNQGHHTVLQVMAGGGKSITFQLPALMGQMTVVVSPYRALIKNQTRAIKDAIPTAFLSSDVSSAERQKILKRIENGEIRLLFLTPEQLNPGKSKHASETIKCLTGRIDLLVLDEAHHPKTDDPDFRAAYDPSHLNKAWKKLGKPQCLFLSASLRRESYQAIKKIIKREELKIVRGPLEKTNVGLIKRNFDGTKTEAEKIIWTLLMIRRLKKMGIRKVIIYTNTPRKVVYMMKQLLHDDNRKVYGVHGRKEGVEIHSYHEDGKKKERILLTPIEIQKGQEDFEKVKTGVLSANSAYAEGIDTDVGAVIVHDLPVNIESLYQEVLRCGHRDKKGLAFICVDKKADRFNKLALLKKDRDKMEQYDRDYEFLRGDDEDLWEGLTKPFLKH